MKRKMRRILWISVLALGLMGLVSATTLYYHTHRHQGTVTTTASMEEYLDGLLWSNDTMVQWGSTLEPGESYTKNYTIVNTGTAAITLVFIPQAVPLGWSLTWAANGTTISPGEAAIGDLTLTVSSIATDGTYNWSHKTEAHK